MRGASLNDYLNTAAFCYKASFGNKTNGHGIHLFPPYPEKPYFTLAVTDYMYAMPFLEMVKALIQNRIPFKTHELKSVLDYLSGESYFTVNDYDKHYMFYTPGERKLLKYIEWDKPKMLKWK